METKNYIKLRDLEVYKLARELSKIAWEMYRNMNWQTKKIMGDQFITATDSFGANIAEGYTRYHYLDKIKFFYNARASLTEAADHWLELLKEREVVEKSPCDLYKKTSEKASMKLQNLISANYKQKFQ